MSLVSFVLFSYFFYCKMVFLGLFDCPLLANWFLPASDWVKKYMPNVKQTNLLPVSFPWSIFRCLLIGGMKLIGILIFLAAIQDVKMFCRYEFVTFSLSLCISFISLWVIMFKIVWSNESLDCCHSFFVSRTFSLILNV